MEPALILKIINFLSAFFLVLAFLVGVNRKIFAAINLYVFHSLMLAIMAVLIGYYNHESRLFVSAFFVILVKAIIIPHILGDTVKKVGIPKDIAPYLSPSLSMIIEIILIILSYQIVGAVFTPGNAALKNTLAVAIAVFFMGFLMMINRKRIISQVMGFLIMENGLFFFAISLAYGMPLIVELGIFFDVLVVAMIMGILVFKIKESIYSAEKKKFTKLVV